MSYFIRIRCFYCESFGIFGWKAWFIVRCAIDGVTDTTNKQIRYFVGNWTEQLDRGQEIQFLMLYIR